MRGEEFVRIMKELELFNGFVIPIYYYIDDDGNVVLSEQEMYEEMENKMIKVRRLLEKLEE